MRDGRERQVGAHGRTGSLASSISCRSPGVEAASTAKPNTSRGRANLEVPWEREETPAWPSGTQWAINAHHRRGCLTLVAATQLRSRHRMARNRERASRPLPLRSQAGTPGGRAAPPPIRACAVCPSVIASGLHPRMRRARNDTSDAMHSSIFNVHSIARYVRRQVLRLVVVHPSRQPVTVLEHAQVRVMRTHESRPSTTTSSLQTLLARFGPPRHPGHLRQYRSLC